MSESRMRLPIIGLPDRTFLKDLQPGDKVLRLISSDRIPMAVEVLEVNDVVIMVKGGWLFDTVMGTEDDEEMGWGYRHGGVCLSWLDRKINQMQAEAIEAAWKNKEGTPEEKRQRLRMVADEISKD